MRARHPFRPPLLRDQVARPCRSDMSVLPPMCAAAAKIQNDLRILTERLARINDNLARKVSSRTEYDKTITEVRSRSRPN